MKSKLRKRDLRIFKNMEDSIKEMGLKILQSSSSGTPMLVESFFEYAGFSIGILVTFDSQHDLVTISIAYGEAPGDKIDRLVRLVNYINMHINTGHYAIDTGSGRMMLVAGLPVVGHLDKGVFKKLLKDVLGYNLQFSVLLLTAITTDKDPAEIMKEQVVMPDLSFTGGYEDEQ